MVQEMQAIRVSQTVQVQPEAAYRVFASDMTLREWLCNGAYVQSRDGGKLILLWDSGRTVTGAYEVREKGKQIAFSWQELGDPVVSRVRVDFEAAGDATRISLHHEGVQSPSEIEQLWADAFENLQSVLETGNDLRITRRPMLGIMPNFFEEEYARKLGLEKNEGILIGGLVSGMGAEAAGLLKDDVIFKLGGKDTRDFQGLTGAVTGHHAGDVVEVEYWRDGKMHTVQMTLSGRVLPEVPPSAVALGDEVEKIYAQLSVELDEVLQGVTEAEASLRPGKGEWSAKEVVVHLALSERNEHYFIGSWVADDEPLAAPGNQPCMIEAFLSVHPTLADVRTELERLQAETVALLRNLPEDFVARKPTYTRMGQALLQGALHPHLHFDQIREALGATQK